jgi:hypothetical protein
MPHRDRKMSLDSRVEKTLTSAVANQLRTTKCIPTVPFFSYLEAKIANSFLSKWGLLFNLFLLKLGDTK